jgi:hypothetical protein
MKGSGVNKCKDLSKMLFLTDCEVNCSFSFFPLQSLDCYDYYDQMKDLALARLRDVDAMSEEDTDEEVCLL